MKENKKERMESVIQELVAMYVEEESGPQSMITITRVELSSKLKNANIYFSVFPTDQEESVKKFLKRKESALKHHLIKNSKIGQVPQCHFELDTGEKNRQRLDEISNEI